MHEAIRAGARAFLTRDLHGPAFLELLERAALSDRPLSAPPRGPGDRPRQAGPALTPRERDVLSQMALGRTSNRELAGTLGLSENTVRFHVRNILEKLHLHTRAAAVAHALTNGIVSADRY
jgi:DNA-binding NarL/FixJ family response regulator